MDRPKTANTITGKQIDMQEFYKCVIEDLHALAQRIVAIETKLNAMEMMSEIRKVHLKLRSFR